MEITLDQLLASREERWKYQQELIKTHQGLTLVCLTVIMPGKVKRNSHSLIVAQAAITALINRFAEHNRYLIAKDLRTCYEAYLLTDLDHLRAKQEACKIEDEHPLGRLFDIDVMGEDGCPISRIEIGAKARRCLLCDNEARYCMRNHTHSQEELHHKINEMVEDYVLRF